MLKEHKVDTPEAGVAPDDKGLSGGAAQNRKPDQPRSGPQGPKPHKRKKRKRGRKVVLGAVCEGRGRARVG